MLSLQLIREKPEEVRAALARRHTETPLDFIIALDGEGRETLREVEQLRAERDALSKERGERTRLAGTAGAREAKHAEHRRSDLVARSAFLGERLQALEEQLRAMDARLR